MPGDSASYDYYFKYVLVGSKAAGKSSLALQFSEKAFKSQYKLTFSADLSEKAIKLHNDKQAMLEIWDTPGAENFHELNHGFYHGAVAFLLVYDVTNRETFNQLSNRLDQIRKHADPDAVIMLVATKADLIESRDVKIEEGERFARENELLFTEVSAKNAMNVEKAFADAASKVYEKVNSGVIKAEKVKKGIRDDLVEDGPAVPSVPAASLPSSLLACYRANGGENWLVFTYLILSSKKTGIEYLAKRAADKYVNNQDYENSASFKTLCTLGCSTEFAIAKNESLYRKSIREASGGTHKSTFFSSSTATNAALQTPHYAEGEAEADWSEPKKVNGGR